MQEIERSHKDTEFGWLAWLRQAFAPRPQKPHAIPPRHARVHHLPEGLDQLSAPH